MQEVSFSIPVSGLVRINEDTIEIIVNRAETTIEFQREAEPPRRISFEPGRNMFDLVLDASKNVIKSKGINEFSAAMD